MAQNFFDQFDTATPQQRRQTEADARANAAEERANAANARAQAEFEAKFGTVKAPGDLTKTGEDYLATVDPLLAKQARMFIEGRRAFPTGLASRNPQMQAILAVATQADPTLDAANAATRVATRKDFTSGKSATNITALNTALGHINTMLKAGNALQNTSMPVWNRVANWGAVQTGDPRVNKFNIARDAVASELTRVFRGMGGNKSDIDEWKANINASQSPEQLQQAAAQAFDLLNSRLDAMGEQYSRGMGASRDPMELLTPHAREIYKSLSEGRAVGTAAQAAGGASAAAGGVAPAEGGQPSGEPVKGYRFGNEQDIVDYANSAQFTPEGYAALVSQAAKASGVPVDDAYTARALEEGRRLLEARKAGSRIGGVDYSAVDKSATENAGLGASVAQMLRNTPESAANLVTGLVAPITDLGKSIEAGEARGMYDTIPALAGGLLAKAGVGNADEATVNAFGGMLADKYGSMAGVKRALVTDPLAVAGDVSLLLTGGGSAAARLPGLAGRAGELAATAGRAIDPLSALVALPTEVAPAAARKIGEITPDVVKAGLREIPSEFAGAPSGIGGGAIREAYAAGKSKGRAGGDTAQSAAFTRFLRGEGDAADLVAEARRGLDNMRETLSQRYRADIAPIKQDKTQLDFGAVEQAVADLKPKNFGVYTEMTPDEKAWAAMNDVVQEHKALDPSQYNTPEQLDLLKQRLYDVGIQTDPNARRISRGAYNAVKGVIVDQAPAYAGVMKDYETGIRHLQDIEGSLSLGSKAGIDTSARKLNSILRDNVTSNYGRRTALGRDLEGATPDSTLFPMLAGQTAATWRPRGLPSALGAMSIGGGATVFGLPATVAGLALAPAFMPRLAGEAAYGAGRAVGATGRALTPAVDKASDLLGDLYAKYQEAPTLALGTAKLGETEREMERRNREELLRRYAISAGVE